MLPSRRQIFGIVDGSGALVHPADVDRLHAAANAWGDTGETWRDGPGALGGHPCVDVEMQATVVVRARPDDSDAVARALGRPAGADDATLVRLAYRRWGVACVDRLDGDWSFAA